MPTSITETEPRHATLAAALAAFQAEAPRLIKDEHANVKGQTKDGRDYDKSYNYADLAQVTETLNPILGRHGLAFSSTPTMQDGHFVLAYGLWHEGSDERLGGIWPLPNPMQTAPQQVGIAITYARRYALMAVTNTFPDKEDSDGNGYKQPDTMPAREELPQRERQTGSRQQRQNRQGRQQVPDQQRRGPRTWTDAEVQELHLKIAAATPPEALKMYDWMVSKDLHDREVPHPTIPDETASARFVFADRIAQEAVKPGSTREFLVEMRRVAEARELLREQVSETETLDEALAGVLALRNAEALDTDNARHLRGEAEASWADPSGGPE